MKISELPPGLRELAELRREKWPSSFPLENLGFPWMLTPEGWNFWRKVNEGNFTPYYNCRIVNCKPKEKSVKLAE